MKKIAEQLAKKLKQRSTSESRKRPTVTDDPGQDRSIRQKYPKLLSTSTLISAAPALGYLKTISVWGVSGCSALVPAGFMKNVLKM